jgi:hypothetical protein
MTDNNNFYYHAASQRERTLVAFAQYPKGVTTRQLIYEFDVPHVALRIKELRGMGYNIVTRSIFEPVTHSRSKRTSYYVLQDGGKL